jgi:hypothetical protein
MDDEFQWNLLGGLAMAGVGVSLMNIRTAILLGMGFIFVMVVFMFIYSLSLIHPEKGWNLASQIITTSGSIIALLVLIGFYSICLVKNSDYLSDGMPDTWYLFSYFVVIVTGMNIMSIVQYMKTRHSEYNTLSMLLSTILFGFIMIEAIICSYFRTDGFTQ